MGGELHQCLLVSCIFQMHIPFASPFGSDGAGAGTFQKLSVHCARIQMRRVRVRYAGAGPHTSHTFPACPWKFCVAASRLPCLWRLYSRGSKTDGGFSFYSYCLGFRVPCVVRFAHLDAGRILRSPANACLRELCVRVICLCCRLYSRGAEAGGGFAFRLILKRIRSAPLLLRFSFCLPAPLRLYRLCSPAPARNAREISAIVLL